MLESGSNSCSGSVTPSSVVSQSLCADHWIWSTPYAPVPTTSVCPRDSWYAMRSSTSSLLVGQPAATAVIHRSGYRAVSIPGTGSVVVVVVGAIVVVVVVLLALERNLGLYFLIKIC